MVRDRDVRTRARLTVSLGVYLFFTPEIWAVDGEAVSSRNSRFVGVCIVGVTVWTLAIPWLKGAEWIKVVLGCWLLVAPLVLGYGGTAAWNARGAGARTLLGKPSEIEVEMCALGCSACMDDLITLALLVREVQVRSGPLRRMKLRASFRCAVDSLSRTRQALGLYTVSVPSEEQHR